MVSLNLMPISSISAVLTSIAVVLLIRSKYYNDYFFETFSVKE